MAGRMDPVASCKDKLSYFRVKELKEVLHQLGLSKQGKKQDLVDRIISILSDEQGTWAKKIAVGKEKVAKLVDDTYRKIHGSSASDLASNSEVDSVCTNVKLKEEILDSAPVEITRCPCGSTLHTESMIKCDDTRCNVWQHIACVVIPDNQSLLPNPRDIFYCEICRLNRADPFWLTTAHPLYPVKLNIANSPLDGSNPSLSIQKTFYLSRVDRDLLNKQDYDVQAWCMLLNDKVAFRMHWPQYADLQVNGVPVRATNRPGSQLLGANGRDDGQIITTHCITDGINNIFLGGCDARPFCLGVRIVKKRTLLQVLNMIPKETEGECFEDALSRVRRCVGGGAATENADSDSDIEVVADCIPVNLRCPMSGLRMKVAGRFKDCAHMGCFDLHVFVEMNQRSRKWQCPICLKNYCLEKIIIDPYFNRITSKMQNCAEDVAEIEVKPDGSWRAKDDIGNPRSLGELGLWHLPDGSLASTLVVDAKPIRPKFGPDGHAGLRLGIKKNPNGHWNFNKVDAKRCVSHTFDEEQIPTSNSATVIIREREDRSIDLSTTNWPKYESAPMNVDSAVQGFTSGLVSAPGENADVIVLSDSDEDQVPLPSSGGACKGAGSGSVGVAFSDPQHGIHDPFYDPNMVGGIDLFNANDEVFGMNEWQLPPGCQGGAGFQFFSSDVDVAVTLLGMQHTSLSCAPSTNGGFALAEGTTVGSAAVIPNTANKSVMDDGFLDHPLPYGSSHDPSLQMFLPSARSDAMTSHLGSRNHPAVPNGTGNEDWISLRLGDAGMGEIAMSDSILGHHQEQGMAAPSFSGVHEQARAAPLAPVATSGSSLPGTDNGPGEADGERSNRFPRWGSARSRFYLSIDSDSSG